MDDRGTAIEETFRRIRRPLQWPMEHFRRRRVATTGFAGYRFSRVRRRSVAGFAFGFLLRDRVLPIAAEPPEAVAYAFVRPVGSALHEELVTRRGSPVRRLVAASQEDGIPFEFRPDTEAAAIRHRSLRRVPPELFVLTACDFFMLSYRPMGAASFLERMREATTRAGP